MEWLDTAQASTKTGRSRWTIRTDAEQGRLHGHQPLDRTGQPKPKGRWSFASTAVDAYMQGHSVDAQRQACGCPRLQAVASGRRRSA